MTYRIIAQTIATMSASTKISAQGTRVRRTFAGEAALREIGGLFATRRAIRSDSPCVSPTHGTPPAYVSQPVAPSSTMVAGPYDCLSGTS